MLPSVWPKGHPACAQKVSNKILIEFGIHYIFVYQVMSLGTSMRPIAASECGLVRSAPIGASRTGEKQNF